MVISPKKLVLNLILSHASPEEVAQGFALGTFISMTPLLGLHTLLAVIAAALLKKNEIATILGAWVVNPLTLFPIYYFTYRMGHLILGTPHSKELRPESIKDFFHIGANLMRPLWIGGLFVGLISAIVGYYLMLWLYPLIKAKIHRHRAAP